MVDAGLLLLAGILVFDFVVSLWNAYASGIIWGLVGHEPGRRFERITAAGGVGLAFAGMAYTLTIVLAGIALLLGIIGGSDFTYLVSFDFLVFGAMIIGFGAVVTVQSIVVAWQKRSFGSIAISVWNTFAEVWDVATYLQGLRTAATVVKGGARGKGAVYVLFGVAIALALIITYFAFHRGLLKARGEIQQRGGEGAARLPSPAEHEARHHRAIRGTILTGIVVFVVVVAALAALHFTGAVP